MNTKHADAASGCCLPNVLRVDDSRDITKIVYSVVAWVAVDVVNALPRKSAVAVKPGKAMSPMNIPVNAYLTPAEWMDCAGDHPDSDSVRRDFTPRKNAGLWIVVKKFAQTLRGKIGLSHEALLLLIGQRPDRVASACPASLF
jgi:hypothetical protein